MEKPVRPTAEYLAEFGWAMLLFNAAAAGVGVLVGAHMESVRLGLALFLGGSITVTLLLVLVVAGTVGWDAIARARARPRRDRGGKENAMAFTISSPAFGANAGIPTEYTCDGRDTSPPLAWEDLPAGTASLVLIVDDPDAPDPRAPKRTWVHWVVYDIPPAATGLAAGASPRGLPAGAREGLNDWGRSGYGGPCPPVGQHRYFHKLYALDTTLPELKRPTRAQLEQAMAGHVLARTELVGTYLRNR